VRTSDLADDEDGEDFAPRKSATLGLTGEFDDFPDGQTGGQDDQEEEQGQSDDGDAGGQDDQEEEQAEGDDQEQDDRDTAGLDQTEEDGDNSEEDNLDFRGFD
jgi:hypothetical protein